MLIAFISLKPRFYIIIFIFYERYVKIMFFFRHYYVVELKYILILLEDNSMYRMYEYIKYVSKKIF